MDLKDYRDKIDEIDKKIVELYEERMTVSEQVADYKLSNGMNVLDKSRESAKLEAVKELTHS